VFADAALAARVDRAEARLCSRMALSNGQRAAAAGPFVLPLSGGLAVYAGTGSPMNKVIGIGLDQPLDEAGLELIEQRWHERGEPVRIELSILTEPALAATLSGRGYRLHGFENVLARPVPDSPDAPDPPGITVDAIAGDCFEEWLDVAVDSFANMDGTGSPADPVLPREELKRLIGDGLGAEDLSMVRYIARIGERAVGEAALSMDDGLALLAGSGTLPQFRGRGVQKALVSRRLADARNAGCDLAVVVTAPGTRSQENVMRRGFVLLYTRAILIKPAPTRPE
jgi:GNAT superfamily N-acetyltransferase